MTSQFCEIKIWLISLILNCPHFIGTIQNFEDFDQFIVRSEKGSRQCGLCFNFESKDTWDLRNHIEARHFPDTFNYQCPECSIVLRTNKAYKNHKNRAHKVIWSRHLSEVYLKSCDSRSWFLFYRNHPQVWRFWSVCWKKR